VFFHERGEIRDRSFESQAFRASGLNLVVSAIVHWNTVHLGRAVDHLRRQGRAIRPEVLKHVSPLSWEHINLTGTYAWGENLCLGRDALAGRWIPPLTPAAALGTSRMIRPGENGGSLFVLA
jgi:hypothetical protein